MVVSSGLGGGSLIYANVMLEKDEETFVREDLSAGGREHWPIGWGDLEKHYDNVRAMQAPQRYPSDVEPYASTSKTVAIEDAAETLGLTAERPELAVLFAPPGGDPVPGAPVPGDNLHHRPRTTCVLCGECDLGCNFGAKNTLDYTYLTDAQREGRAAHLLRGADDRAAGPRRGLPDRLPAARRRTRGARRGPAGPEP